MPVFEPLSKEHDREHFDCGVPDLNGFLQQTARQHQEKGLSRTCVLVPDETSNPRPIIGFFTLTASEALAEALPPELGKRLPARVPVVVLARLAVSLTYQKQGCGAVILAEALSTVAALAEKLGIAGLFVDAKDEGAAAFYRRFGFTSLPSQALRLFLPLATVHSLIRKNAVRSLL